MIKPYPALPLSEILDPARESKMRKFLAEWENMEEEEYSAWVIWGKAADYLGNIGFKRDPWHSEISENAEWEVYEREDGAYVELRLYTPYYGPKDTWTLSFRDPKFDEQRKENLAEEQKNKTPLPFYGIGRPSPPVDYKKEQESMQEILLILEYVFGEESGEGKSLEQLLSDAKLDQAIYCALLSD
jgi:hypothetical protein